MESESEEPRNFKPEEKVRYEIEKIIAEIKVLKKPYLQLSFWIGLVALAVSIATNVGQALTYESRTLIADAKVAQAKLDMLAMNEKRDQVKAEVENLQLTLNGLKGSVTEAQQSANSPQVQRSLNEVQEKIADLQQSAKATSEKLDTSESAATTKFRDSVETAKAKEREGFQFLIDGDYDSAITSFQESEDSLNSYNNVYDIAKLLRENRSKLNDPEGKRETFKTIVNKHSWGAPPDLFKKVKEVAAR